MATALRRAEVAESERREMETRVIDERAKRQATEARLAMARTEMQTMQEIMVELEARLENAQRVLNCRLEDHRQLADVECCIAGCPDMTDHQASLLQWVCRCTTARYACTHCIGRALGTHACEGANIMGVKCPHCATVTTKWSAVSRADVQPQQWRVDWQLDD